MFQKILQILLRNEIASQIGKFHILSSGRAMILKFMFSKKATKIDEIFTIDLTFTTLK